MKKTSIVVCAFLTAQVAAAPSAFAPTGVVVYEAQGPVGKFKGNNKAITGKFTWEKDSDKIAGKICIDQKMWQSGEGIRDDHTRKMFEVEKYPNACLELSGFDGDLKSGKITLLGKLTMHGVSADLKIPGSAKQDGDKLSFTGQFATKVSAWKMERPNLLGITVGDDITVAVASEAKAVVP